MVYNLPDEIADDMKARTECDNAKFVTMIKECLGLDVRVTKSLASDKQLWYYIEACSYTRYLQS